jgi:hypothetical protein
MSGELQSKSVQSREDIFGTTDGLGFYFFPFPAVAHADSQIAMFVAKH